MINKMIRASALGLMLVFVVGAFAQTKIEMPENKYPADRDVALRTQFEPEVFRQLKVIKGDDLFELQMLVEEIGQRLVKAIPSDYPDNGFKYRFVIIDTPEVNAFALPGGFIAVNRGMISLCNNGDELAAVMAHEVSHVVLRHGTAKLTKQSKFSFTFAQLGVMVLGAMGTGGQAGAAGGIIALNIYQLKYDRQYEKQADILGSRILVRAGYGAYNMESVMRHLQALPGTGGISWLQSHPNPERRVEYLAEEAKMLPPPATPAPTHYAQFKKLQVQLKDRK